MKTVKRRPAERSRRTFAVCVQNSDLRVVEESGEDYLYPADWFVLIEVPKKVQTSVLKPGPA